MTQLQYIEKVAKYVKKYAPQYGIMVYSPIIAQFCLESGYGTTNKVKKILDNGTVDWRHNYAGLKWRDGRCAISNDYFEEGTAEQNPDGSYVGITSKFYRFKSLEECVIGYFQFTNIPAYSNLKGVTDPETYLKNIKADKYATSIDYVQKNMNVIKKWNLAQYDPIVENQVYSDTQKYFHIQCGAYSNQTTANTLKDKLNDNGFDFIVKKDGLYKVQMGNYLKKVEAETILTKVKNKGFGAIIVHDGNKIDSTTKENTVITNKKYKVAIDAGHGSNTAGKRTPDGYREHWHNVKCANYFEQALNRCGVDTFRVGWDDTNATDDTDVSLTVRQNQIKNEECDYSVSWHANAHGNGNTYTTGQGVETLIHNRADRVGDSKALAMAIQSYLIKGTNQKNRGVKTDALSMCNCQKMGTKASVLIETAFMTNEYETQLIRQDSFCFECAEEAAQGMCQYLKITYVKPKTTVSNTVVKPSISTMEVPLKINQDKKDIQRFLNEYYGEHIKEVIGAELVIDGSIGAKSKKALVIAFQVELNKLGANLEIDGSFGSKTAAAFTKYVGTLKKGMKGSIFITLWQCVLVGRGLDPNGIDGSYGNGCLIATNALFAKIGLVKDSSVSGADVNALL